MSIARRTQILERRVMLSGAAADKAAPDAAVQFCDASDGWRITIDPVPHIDSLTKALETMGGYVISQVGKIP